MHFKTKNSYFLCCCFFSRFFACLSLNPHKFCPNKILYIQIINECVLLHKKKSISLLVALFCARTSSVCVYCFSFNYLYCVCGWFFILGMGNVYCFHHRIFIVVVKAKFNLNLVRLALTQDVREGQEFRAQSFAVIASFAVQFLAPPHVRPNTSRNHHRR